MTYEEGLAIRKKWMEGATAEWMGFWDSKLDPKERDGSLYKHDPYRQQRYELGLADGLAMLQADQVKGHG